jgi:ABC-type proline/glycine betaine transport system ATPase subunit
VLVTHDSGEAEELGDVVIALDEGHVSGTRVVGRAISSKHEPAAPESTGSA